MLVACHQVTARLPGADCEHDAPGQVDDQHPDQEIRRRRKFRALADDAVPGCDTGLRAGCQPFDRRGEASEAVEYPPGRDERREGEQQEHDRVGEDDATRTRIHRERRVTDPGDDERLSVTQVGQAGQQDRRTLGHDDEVAAERDDDRQSGGDLHAPAVETLAEVVGDGRRAAPAQVAPEEQCAVDITYRGPLREQQERTHLPVVCEAGLAEEQRRAVHARHQRPDDQDRRCPPARDIVVVELADAPAREITDDDVDDDAGDDRPGEDIHQFIRYRAMSARNGASMATMLKGVRSNFPFSDAFDDSRALETWT